MERQKTPNRFAIVVFFNPLVPQPTPTPVNMSISDGCARQIELARPETTLGVAAIDQLSRVDFGTQHVVSLVIDERRSPRAVEVAAVGLDLDEEGPGAVVGGVVEGAVAEQR